MRRKFSCEVPIICETLEINPDEKNCPVSSKFIFSKMLNKCLDTVKKF